MNMSWVANTAIGVVPDADAIIRHSKRVGKLCVVRGTKRRHGRSWDATSSERIDLIISKGSAPQRDRSE